MCIWTFNDLLTWSWPFHDMRMVHEWWHSTPHSISQRNDARKTKIQKANKCPILQAEWNWVAWTLVCCIDVVERCKRASPSHNPVPIIVVMHIYIYITILYNMGYSNARVKLYLYVCSLCWYPKLWIFLYPSLYLCVYAYFIYIYIYMYTAREAKRCNIISIHSVYVDMF